jgi:hypothetical protein
MLERPEIELHTLDPRTLTPAQWGALKRLAKARAHAERAKAFRVFFRTILAWFRGKRPFPPLLRHMRLPLGAGLGRS